MPNQAALLDSTEMNELVSKEIRPVKTRKTKKPKIKLKHSMAKLVEMRWDATRADENSIRRRYKSELTVEAALAELAQLRRLCETAGYEINQRLNHVDQKCASCGNPMDGRRAPTMIEPVRDPETGTISNNFYCSIICVQRRNMKKLGREELIK